MALATESITPLKNAKLLGPLDCNGQLLSNADPASFPPGGGNGGNDTGTTTAILKGDGNHGFADAVPDTDYASPGAVGLKEDATDHDADVATINTSIASLTTAVGNKADSASVSAALAAKADTAAVTSALATKEPTLPTTANDAYVLARHNAGAGGTWYFVDPATLGTTNQSFVDGQSFTNTNFDSASAQFNSGDVGKTITGTNIPAATTILSITSATRVVLSQPTTGTGSALPFTIFNRFTVAGGGGTVTNVSTDNTNGPTELFGVSVSNQSTTPVVTFTKPVATAPKTFYGNGSNLTAPAGFMTQAGALSALDVNTAGKSIMQVPNPNAITIPRWNVDNSVTPRTPAQLKGDMGAENALSFSTPLNRAAGSDTVTLPAATDTAAGHLTAADHATFVAKVPPGRTLSVTSPLTIGTPPAVGGSADLSANRTMGIQKATGAADGYLAAADFNKFLGTTMNVATLPPGGAVTITNTAGQAPITRLVIFSQLTSLLDVTLPPASDYFFSSFAFLEIVDLAPGGAFANFALQLRRSGSDTIDGGTLPVLLSRGLGYLRINSNAAPSPGGAWFTTKYFVQSFIDPVTPTKRVLVDISRQPSLSSGNFKFIPTTVGDGGSVPETPGAEITTLDPDDPDAYVTGFRLPSAAGGTGTFRKNYVKVTNVVHSQDEVVNAELTAGNSYTHTIDVGADTVRFAADLNTLGQSATLVWPPSTAYKVGTPIRFRDAGGTLSTARTVTIVPTPGSGDLFNGASSYVINQANAVGQFVVDVSGTTGAWLVEGFSVANSGTPAFAGVLSENSGAGTLTWNCTKGQTQQTAITTPAGDRTLIINNYDPGMQFELMYFQPTAGSKKLTLPSNSWTASRVLTDGVSNASTTFTSAKAVFTVADVGKRITSAGNIPSQTTIASINSPTSVVMSAAATTTASGLTFTVGGKGLIALSPLSNAWTKISGTYYGGISGAFWFWDVIGAEYSPQDVIVYNTPVQSLPITWGTGLQNVAKASQAKYIATGPYVPSSTASIGRIDIPIITVGAPTGDVTLHVYNSVGGIPDAEIATSAPIANASFIPGQTTAAGANASPYTFTLNAPVTLSTGGTYWIGISSTSFNTSNYFQWSCVTGAAGFPVKQSITGAVGSWVNFGVNANLNFKTYAL
jgi:hypothetical protein